MKSTSLVTFFLLAIGSASLSACGDDDSKNDPKPIPPQPVSTTFQLGMQGYLTTPGTVGRFGVASTLSDAQLGKGTEVSGKTTFSDTNNGKDTKSFVLPSKLPGSKYWVFLSTKQKPTGSQTISVTWPINGLLTLSAASADTIVIQEMTVQ